MIGEWIRFIIAAVLLLFGLFVEVRAILGVYRMNYVMNRMQDEEFPGTIEKVVMQPGQFEPVDNGSFYEVTPDWECVEALEMVASGWDQSRGATYFEESYVGSWQSVNLEKLFVHGCHTFYKDNA